MNSEKVIYRSDSDFGRLPQAMRFRLHYEGPFLAANGDPRDGQEDKKRVHKHTLRRAFHNQLKHLWETNGFLSTARGGYDIFGIPRPDDMPKLHQDQPLFRDVLAEIHEVNGRKFVPLVCEEIKLLCGLDILLLRRDRPGKIIHARDIDNRLKTLFDALRMPRNLGEIADCDFSEDEDPMFVLLQEDSLISQVSVETDDLLSPPPHAGSDDSFARVLITVDIRHYEATMFNISYG